MIQGRLLDADNKKCLFTNVSRTTNAFERMRGLLFQPPLNHDQALLIKPCNSVHMFGMSYALDLIFLDKNWTIIKLVEHLKPWRVSACPGAKMVVELQSYGLNKLSLNIGQQLEWQNETH